MCVFTFLGADVMLWAGLKRLVTNHF